MTSRVLVSVQANEKLQTARTAKGAAERAAQLRESLALFKQVAPHLDMSVVCNQFVQARFFSGEHSHHSSNMNLSCGCDVTTLQESSTWR